MPQDLVDAMVRRFATLNGWREHLSSIIILAQFPSRCYCTHISGEFGSA